MSRGTEDVDARIAAAHGAVEQAAHAVARRRGWSASWLNEAVTQYVPPHHDPVPFANYPSDARVGLRVRVGSPEQILAMKLAALRAGTVDLEDAVTLAKATGLTTAEALLDLHRRYFPDHPLDARRLAGVEEVAERAARAS